MKKVILFFFIGTLGIFNCAHNMVKPKLIRLTDYPLERSLHSFMYPQNPSDTPSKAQTIVDHHFYKNMKIHFIEAISSGNYLLQTWPDHDYASPVANRLAWAALFTIDMTGDNFTFEQIDENTYRFCQAQFFCSESARLDKQPNQYFTKRSSELLIIIREGYLNQNVFREYIEAKKLIVIDTPILKQYTFLKKAKAILEDIRLRYPHWLPEILDMELADINQQIGRE